MEKEDSTMTDNQLNQQAKKPDETFGFNIEGHIKIFDPDSGEVYIDKSNSL